MLTTRARSSSNLIGVSCRRLFLVVLFMLTTATTTALAADKTKNKNKKDDAIMSITRMAKILMGHQEYKVNTDTADKTTELLVIGAGFGRTGTTSYMAAMERLGLQSYHMKAVLGTPGHLDLWIEYLTEKQKHEQQQIVGENENQQDTSQQQQQQQNQIDKIVHGLASAGFDATASMPACIAFQDLMERYPNARVVVTIRGDGNGDAWATSILNSVAGFLPAIHRIPFCWFTSLQKFAILLPMVWEELGAPVDTTSHLPNRHDLAQAYDAWLVHVQSIVPSEKLLLFAAQSGWQPLCEFLSPLDIKIELTCREILDSGEVYPRANESAMVQDLLYIFNIISWIFEHAIHFLGIMLLLLVVRRRRAAAAIVNNNKKKKD